MPITYDYQTGSTIFMSNREKTLADAYLETLNYKYSAQVVREKFHTKTTEMTIRHWLNRPHVRAYMADRLKDRGLANGMTRDKWLADSIAYREGKKQANAATVKMHELIGRALGYLEESSRSTINAENLQINFTEQG